MASSGVWENIPTFCIFNCPIKLLDWWKLVFPEKIDSVQEKLSSLMKIKQNEKCKWVNLIGQLKMQK